MAEPGAGRPSARRGRLSGISIRWKLTVAYVVLVTGIVAVLGIALYRGLESFLLDDVGSRMSAGVERVATRDLTRPAFSRDPAATPGRSAIPAARTSGVSPATWCRSCPDGTRRSW